MKANLVLIQMDIKFGDPESNFLHVQQLFQEANLKPNDIVILPELWNTGYDLTRLAAIADGDGKKTQHFLLELAQKYEVFIAGGSVARKTKNNYFNTSYLVSPTGETAQYDKVHLFRLMNEEKYLSAGDKGTNTNFQNLRVTQMICYDLRFPEWFRKFGFSTDLFIVSAQWPESRIKQWKELAVARAIENQCFVAAVNRVGQDPDNRFGGRSLVAAPAGEILTELGDQEEIKKIEIDLSLIENTRGQIPVFEDRRIDLY